MLREHSDIDRHARWSDVKKKVDADPRYKAVEGGSTREDWFRDYCKMLKDEKKKAKEKDREHKKDKEKHKKRDRDGGEKHSKEKAGKGEGKAEKEEAEKKEGDDLDETAKEPEEVFVACL